MNIGKHIVVTDSPNQQLVGKRGLVVNETTNTIQLNNGTKLIKHHITFEETT